MCGCHSCTEAYNPEIVENLEDPCSTCQAREKREGGHVCGPCEMTAPLSRCSGCNSIYHRTRAFDNRCRSCVVRQVHGIEDGQQPTEREIGNRPAAAIEALGGIESFVYENECLCEICDWIQDFRPDLADIYCRRCGSPFATTEAGYIMPGGDPNGEILPTCRGCRRNRSNTCEGCGNRWVSGLQTVAGRVMCPRCMDGDFEVCEFCREVYRVGNDCGCDKIYPYNYRPKEFVFLSLDREPLSKRTPYLGFELEVEALKGPWTRKRAVKECSPFEWLYCMFDGSIDRQRGFEIVSHPFTYEWWLNNTTQMEELLAALSAGGVRSYESGACGMHVHISKDAFSHLHLLRFMQMIYDHAGLALTIAQRGRSSRGIREYARLDDADSSNLPEKAREKANINERRHYCAVHLGPKADPTAEVRIYRGTLNFGSFTKNIEHVHSLWAFTSAPSHVSEGAYLSYLREHMDQYPNLVQYLTKRNYLD